MVKTVYITGYKSFELNIYKDDAPEVYYLKQFIAHKLKHLLDEGLEWVLIQGQMGIELWSAEVVIELKKDFPDIKLGIITPFIGHTQRWNDKNQAKYTKILYNKPILLKAFITLSIWVPINLNKQINSCLIIPITLF